LPTTDSPEGVGSPTPQPDLITHYWGLGGISHCGRDVGIQEGHAYTNNWDSIDCPGCLVYKPGTPTPQLQKFYLTFGVKYSHETHPYWEGVDPNGWVLILAPDEPTARALAHVYFRESWAFLYDGLHFDEAESRSRFYPKGALAVIEPDGARSLFQGVGDPTPSVEEPAVRTVNVSWYHTEHFRADLEVPGDFDINADDADDKLEQIIIGLEQDALGQAFDGCTDRQITHKEMY
jgi:hypothetical protein